jgi:hypothetical protein
MQILIKVFMKNAADTVLINEKMGYNYFASNSFKTTYDFVGGLEKRCKKI